MQDMQQILDEVQELIEKYEREALKALTPSEHKAHKDFIVELDDLKNKIKSKI